MYKAKGKQNLDINASIRTKKNKKYILVIENTCMGKMKRQNIYFLDEKACDEEDEKLILSNWILRQTTFCCKKPILEFVAL